MEGLNSMQIHSGHILYIVALLLGLIGSLFSLLFGEKVAKFFYGDESSENTKEWKLFGIFGLLLIVFGVIMLILKWDEVTLSGGIWGV